MDNQHEVPEELDGARLDKALVGLFRLSRARAKRAIEEGAVRVNGRRVPKGATVAKGDALLVDLEKIADPEAVPTANAGAPLVVRYESDTVLVVDKPAGQPTAPLKPNETSTLVNAILGRYPELVPKDGAFIGHALREPGIVHRLDTDTSGLVVVARTAGAFDTLRGALKADVLKKQYLLICAESELADHGTIEFPIANHPKDQRRVYPCIHPRDVMRYEPRPAVTSYRVTERRGRWALVEVEVSRALRHQIRAHFAAIAHPLAGDTLYGGAPVRALGRHALHASRVAFEGGPDVAPFDVTSPLPDDLQRFFEAADQGE